MEERNEISVELGALSVVVSGISRVTPYGVPEGYFAQLPAAVVGRLAARSSTFQVPEGYFDGFAANVLARIKGGAAIGNEDALPPIFSRITRVTPYQAPEGYFEELSPLLAILRDKPVYTVPQEYFDELSPVLTVAHDRSTYQVPEGYFAGLPERVLEKVAGPVTAAKVIPMEHVVTDRREDARGGGEEFMRREGVLKGHWWKYSSVAAIAACFLLIFSWPQGGNNVMPKGDKMSDLQAALQKVSDQEMQAYLDDQHSILTEPASNTTATLDMNEGDVKSLLSDVSDSDLQNYMEEHGKAEDLATN